MQKVDFPPRELGGKDKADSVDLGRTPQGSNGSPILKNINNIHLKPVYEDCCKHPGSTQGEIEDRLGFSRGTPASWRHRILIGDSCEILTFFKLFEKRGHRYYPTGKVPLEREHEPQKFTKDGLPIAQQKQKLCMPEYPHPTPSGCDE